MEEQIAQILADSQIDGSHLRRITTLKNVYESTDFDHFSQCFLRLLQGIIQENFQNPRIKNILEFSAKFVAHMSSVENRDGSNLDSEAPTHPLLKAVVQCIIQYHDDPAIECRHNTCSFLSMTLQNIGDNAVVDSHIIDLIQNAMLKIIQDPKHLIRLQAVLALTRLQDPLNPECPVIQAYLNCLRDTNYLVRQEAVKRIAPNALTIPKLQEKTRDREPAVRSAAFTHVADIGLKYFKIVHRQFILKSGFAETNSQVKKIFFEYLLPKWLTSLNGSYLELLHAVKLDADENDIINTEELSSQIMQVFFKTEPINSLLDALPLEKTKLIPENAVRSELAHYWNIVTKYLRQSEDLEDILENILPELILFCGYIEKLINNRLSKSMEDWEHLDFQYMLYHLFDMAEQYDLSEEVGRRALDELIKKVLRMYRLQPRLLNKIIQIGSKLASNVNSFTNEICHIISDIWQPLIDKPQSADQDREKNFKIAEVTVKLIRLEAEREEAVTAQDFIKAQELTTTIQESEKKIQELKSDVPEKVQTTAEDPETLCWCLDLLAALLAHSNVKKLTPSLVTCREDFLMPLITNESVEIAWRAFKCLTSYCIFDLKLAEKYLRTLCTPIASYCITPNVNKNMLMDSMAVVTDLIRIGGSALFNTENGVNAINSTQRRLYNIEADEVDSLNNRLSIDFIMSLLLDMLDDEDSEIGETAVMSIAKLILNELPANPMVMARLILKWYNPVTERGIQQRLGVIISAFTERISNGKEIVAKSVVPLLTNIAEAPRTSPLAEIDIDNVIKFLAAITDSETNNNLLHIHIELARILTQEVYKRPTGISTTYFAKMLTLLNITANNSPAIKELITNCELILEKETLEKGPKQYISAFITKLNGESINSTTAVPVSSADETSHQNTTSANSALDDTESRMINAKKALPNSNLREMRGKGFRKRRKSDPNDESSPGGDRADVPVINNDEQGFILVGDRIGTNPQEINSEPDVIPSSQPETQSTLKRTRSGRIICLQMSTLKIAPNKEKVNKNLGDKSDKDGSSGSSSSQATLVSQKLSTRGGNDRSEKEKSPSVTILRNNHVLHSASRVYFDRNSSSGEDSQMRRLDSPARNTRNKLKQIGENDIRLGKDLFIRLNGASDLNNKSIQVKRKKSRRSKAMNNGASNVSQIFKEQTVHVIIEPSDSCDAHLSDNSTNRRETRNSRRIQLAVTDSSSDESTSTSIRRSNRKVKK